MIQILTKYQQNKEMKTKRIIDSLKITANWQTTLEKIMQ